MSVHLVDRFVLNSGVERAVVTVAVGGLMMGADEGVVWRGAVVEGGVLVSLLASLATISDLVASSRNRSSLEVEIARIVAAYSAALDRC
jgi:hypothetical protein